MAKQWKIPTGLREFLQHCKVSPKHIDSAPSAPRNVSAKLTHSRGLSRPQVIITWNAPRYLNGIIRKYTIVYYYYNMNTSNEKIVTINKTYDLQYIIDDTRKGMLSYKISASTIQEGPYTTGTINLTMLSFVKLKHNAKDVADKRTMLIAGLVAGFIVMVLLLVVGIALWKRNRNQKMKQQPPADPIHLNSIVDESSLEVLDNNLNEASNHFLEIEDKKYEDIESCTLAPDLMPVQNVAEFVPPDINKLTQEFETIPAESRYECKEAKKPANKIKNRYKNIVSYDHSLVTLEKIDNDTDSCYINASYIHGYDGTPEAYIATQGPLGNTLSDFWRMIWERNISSIVMLTNLLELGKRKCHQYWPDKSYQYSDITVTTHKTEVFADFVIRTFFISKDGTTNRRVLQFHFTAWPDKGVPDYATAVLAFRRKVLGMSSGSNSPMVIHCSAGVGRTGTYIIIDAMLRQAEKQQNIDIVSYLIAIRDDRPYMVQTLEQYIFVYTAVHEALNCGSTEVQVHNLRIAMQELSAVDKRHRISGYALEFQRLEAVTSQDSQGTFDVGLAKENVKKNRYSYIVAANESRVILSTNGDADKVDYVNISSVDTCRDHKGDYINASFVDTYRNRNAFIMTQAPMKNTIADFWRMVMDYEIGTIVMLNNLKEEYEAKKINHSICLLKS